MDSYVISIDLGTENTSVVCALVDDKAPYGLNIVYQETVDSEGIKRGCIENTERVKLMVQNIVMGIQKKLKKSNRKIFYVANVNGFNYRCETLRYDRNTAGQTISEITLKQLTDEARNKVMWSMDEELTRFYPMYYSLDSQPIIKNPIGCSSNKTECTFLSIITQRSAIEAINRVLPTQQKLSCTYTSASAKASMLLTDDEKKNGVMLVDLGAGTTNIAIAFKGSICYDMSLPFGSATITSDIARGMEVNMVTAEKLKRYFGLNAGASAERVVRIDMGDGSEEFACDTQKLDFIIRARVEEIVKYVDTMLAKTRSVAKVQSIVLAGGGADLKGICDVFSDVITLPTRRGSMLATRIDVTENLSEAIGMASLFARENKKMFDNDNGPSLFDQQPNGDTDAAPEEPKTTDPIVPVPTNNGQVQNPNEGKSTKGSNAMQKIVGFFKDLSDGAAYDEKID